MALIDIDLDQFDDDDILEEARARKLVDSPRDVAGALKTLEEAGCPSDLLAPLRAWASIPVPTPERLAEWKTWAATSTSATG